MKRVNIKDLGSEMTIQLVQERPRNELLSSVFCVAPHNDTLLESFPKRRASARVSKGEREREMRQRGFVG